MTAEDQQSSGTSLDEVMDEIRQELVRRVAVADRDENREIYDALEHE